MRVKFTTNVFPPQRTGDEIDLPDDGHGTLSDVWWRDRMAEGSIVPATVKKAPGPLRKRKIFRPKTDDVLD